jgi:hypothetical protein
MTDQLEWLFSAVAAPAEGDAASSVPTVATAKDLTAVLESVRAKFTSDGLPPTLPTSFKRWKPQDAPDAPHDPHSYFPMILVK